MIRHFSIVYSATEVKVSGLVHGLQWLSSDFLERGIDEITGRYPSDS